MRKNGLFTQVVFQIELKIHDADCVAASEGIVLKDSHIKSCLSKAKLFAKGSSPKAEPKSDRDKFILQLAKDIDSFRHNIRESEGRDSDSEDTNPINTGDWIRVIKIVEDSLKFHAVPGGRSYLDFLTGFIAQARGNV